MRQEHRAAPAAPAAAPDPLAIRRSHGYVRLLILAALIGVPVAMVSYGFQYVVSKLQTWFFDSLPKELGFSAAPIWWPLPVLVLAGILVPLAITRLPGNGGHSPADGFKPAGALPPEQLAGVTLAAIASLSLGVVLGPEAPLIAIGAGLGVLAVRLVKRDSPPQVATVIAAAGSFAAISALLGSPLLGAFLLMEASGLGGPMLGLVLVPGLLAAGVGTLIFIGLDNVTGLGTYSLAIPNLPTFTHVTGVLFLWAIAFGFASAALGWLIHAIGVLVRPMVERRIFVLTPVIGAVIAGLAILFEQVSGHSSHEVLFSGENSLAGLVQNPGAWTAGALLLLATCKALAYGLSLSSFRGGPTFPAMFVGTALGMAVANLPGLSLVPAVGMGLAAMCATMLQLPFTSVLLATVFLQSDSLELMPLIIVAVVVAYVAVARLPEPSTLWPRPAKAMKAAPSAAG